MTENNLFPITAAQRAEGNLNSEGATDIALLQDLTRTFKPGTMHQMMVSDSSGSFFDRCSNLLALAFASDTTFAEVFPDELLHDKTGINHSNLPGLRQDATGEWIHVDREQASNHERREYIRRNLIVDAAKKILGCMNRPVTDRIAVTQPSAFRAAISLANVATDVCQQFDPDFLASINAPGEASLGLAGT